MKKKKISLIAIIAVITIIGMCFSRNSSVKADEATTIQVGSAAEFVQALNTIHEDSNKSYILNLTDNIEFTNDTGITQRNTIDNGNEVTIKGNGHKIKFLLRYQETNNEDTLLVKGAKLNLGLPDGSDSLTLEGAGEGGYSINSLVTADNSGEVNMYNGVTLCNNYSGSSAMVSGGVCVYRNATFNMYGGTIRDNAVETSSVGGAAVHVDGGTFKMTGGTITGNYSSSVAGAVFGRSNAVIEIKNATISDNKAQFGEVIAISTGAQATIDNVTISGAEVSYYGGVAYVEDDATLTIKNSTLEECKAGYGGAIFNYGGIVNLENNTITKCSSSNWGGAIANYEGTANLKGNTITECEASSGGAIYNRDSVALENNIIEENGANYGGVIYNIGGTATSKDNTMKSNGANQGGAIYSANRYSNGSLVSTGSVTSAGDDITENEANYGGGAVIASGNANLSGSYIYNNKAAGAGNDLVLDARASEIAIMDAGSMSKYAEFDGKMVATEKWYTDDEERRFSPNSTTDVVNANELDDETTYFLVAASDRVEDRKYTIKYEANGGSGEMASQTILYDAEVALSKNTFSRSGYNFVAWNTKADGSGESYTDKQTVKNLTTEQNGVVTLYAQWQEVGNQNADSGDEPKDDVSNSDEQNSEVINPNDNTNESVATSITNAIKTGDKGIAIYVVLIMASLFTIGRIKRARKTKSKGKRFK